MRLLYFFIFITLFSCKEEKSKFIIKKNSIDTTRINIFNLEDIGALGFNSELKIYATFDECGEWGGHNESLIIFQKDEFLKVKYTKTEVNCKSFDNENLQKETVSKEYDVTQSTLKKINYFIEKLALSKTKETLPGNAGKIFKVVNSDSTLVIQVYGDNIESLKNYNKILESINIEPTGNQNVK